MPSLPLPVRPRLPRRTAPSPSSRTSTQRPTGADGAPRSTARPGLAERLRGARSPRSTLVLGGIALALMVLAALWAGIAFAAGRDMRGLEQHQSGAVTAALDTSLVAQSFLFARAGLDRVDVVVDGLQPGAAGEYKLVEGDGPGGKLIASVALSRADYSNNPFLTLSFPPIEGSRDVTYTVVLETPGQPLSRSVSVRYLPYDGLSAGTMYSDAGPMDADLSFAAYYRYTPATALADVSDLIGTSLLPTLGWVALLLLPGLAMLMWLPGSLDTGQRVLAAPAVTLLSLPVFYLVIRSVGLPFGTPGVWALLVLSGGAMVWGLVRRRAGQPVAKASKVAPGDVLFWVLLGGVFAATLANRFTPLREVSGGLGLDAYHHTLISRLFIDAGGIPGSYLPYAELSSFTYHFGFHSFVATLAWLTGQTPADQLLLLVPQAGQVASALPVLTLAVFAWRVTGSRWAGLAGGAFAGLYGALPAYYVNWSRFTQGLGLALLPIALVFLVVLIDRPVAQGAQADTGRGVLAAVQRSAPYLLAVISAAGLFLTHYRIAMLYAVFAALFVAHRTGTALLARKPTREVLSPLRRSGILVVLLLAALSPWLLNLYNNFRVHLVGRADAETGAYYSVDSLWPLLGQPSFLFVSGLAVAGLAVAWRRRAWILWIAALAWAVAALWSTPYLFDWAVAGFRLPYAGYLDANTVGQSLWLPISLLGGYAAASLLESILRSGSTLPGTWPRVWRTSAALIAAAVLLLVGLAVAAPVAARVDSKPYIAPADREALEWMRANLPANSLVAGNPFAFPWSPQNVYGSDSGMWVPLLTGARSTIPPLPAYNEKLSDPAYLQNSLQVVAYEPISGRTPDWAGLKRMGVTHIFSGTRGGAFDIPLLLNSPEVELIFHRDAAYLFAIRSTP